jgi:hypothetical protein
MMMRPHLMWHDPCKETQRQGHTTVLAIFAEERERFRMKKVSQKLLWSIIAIALLAPLSATALIVGARVAEVTQGDGSDWLLVALAFGGAAVSALNGLGRRMSQTDRGSDHNQKLRRQSGAMVHLNH